MLRNATKWCLILGISSFFPLCLSPARAQNTGVSGTNLEFYRPSLDSNGYLGVNSPRLLKPGEWTLKISQSVAYSHLLHVDIDGQTVKLVDQIYTSNIIASIGVNEFMTLAVDVPYHPYSSQANFDTLGSYSTRSLGDVRLGMKFRLLQEDEEGARPSVALLLTNSFPTGDENKFLGTSHMVPGGELEVGKSFSNVNTTANVGVQLPWKKEVLGITYNDQLTYGAAIEVPFVSLDPRFSVIGEIRGHFELNEYQTLTAPLEFGFGLKKGFASGFMLSAGGGGGWNNAIGNPRLRAMLAASYTGAVGDRYVIEQSKAGTPKTFHEERLKTAQLQRDLILMKAEVELIQKEHAALREKMAALQGLTEKPVVPAEPAPETVPEPAPEPDSKTTPASAPEPTLETLPSPPVSPPSLDLEKETYTLIHFGRGQASIATNEKERLNKTATFMKEHPEVLLVVADGHTDRTGSRRFNEKLAKERAHNVKKFLVKSGISPQRIQVKSYGSSRPVASNKTEKGQSLNRRVEVRLAKKEAETSPAPINPVSVLDSEPVPIQAPTPPKELKARVYFLDNSLVPSNKSKNRLKDLVREIKKQPGRRWRFVVAGYTDNTGHTSHNNVLSIRRAEAVKKFLVAQGISAKQISVKGYGSHHPIASNKTKKGQTLNRRAEVKVLAAD